MVNNIYSMEDIAKLVDFHNKLAEKFDIPLGMMEINNSEYCIEYYDTDARLRIENEGELHFHSRDGGGSVSKFTDKQISDMIKGRKIEKK